MGRYVRFHDVRKGQWRLLIQREMPVNLPADLMEFWSDVQSPILEHDRSQRVKVLMIDQTKIDMLGDPDAGDRKAKQVEDIRLWAAISQRKQNEGRWRDQAIAEGQVTDGVAIIRKHWRMPQEKSGDYEWPGMEDGEGLAGYAERSLKDREEHYESMFRKTWMFWEKYVDPMQCAWGGQDMENPEVFVQEGERSYVDFLDEGGTWSGKQIRLDDVSKKVIVIGPDETLDEPIDSDSNKKLRFLIVDYKDPKSGKWKICEYVYPAGEFDQGETVNEFDNPLGRCSYFVIPSAEIVRSETDPHLRYRPMMYPLLTVVYTANWCSTLLAAIAQRAISDRSIYVDPKGIPPELVNALEGLGVTQEGAGAQRRLTMRPPSLELGELPIILGTIQAWPNNLPEALQYILDKTELQIQQFTSNRWITGDIDDKTASNTTASLGAGVMQAAGLPFGAELGMSDEYQRQDIESELHAICYWDEGAPSGSQKPYTASAPGKIDFLKGFAEAGTKARITAEMIHDNALIVNVKTSNETQQDKMLKKQEAYLDFHEGAIDDLQLYRELGYDDEYAQRKIMAKYEARKMLAVQYVPLWQQTLNMLFAATVGLNPASIGQQQPMLPPGQAPADRQNSAGVPQQPLVQPPAVGGTRSGGNNPMSGGMM